MLNYENRKHEGNSEKYHTGKCCVEEGCIKPAGTFWSPLWCFDHNVERMNRVTAGIDDAIKRAEIAELVDKQTASLRNWAYESSRTVKALVLAAGGKIVIKNSDKDREIISESVQYGKETTTFNLCATGDVARGSRGKGRQRNPARDSALMTEDEREDLILGLLMEFQQSVGATTDDQKYAFIAGARAAFVTMEDRIPTAGQPPNL